MTLVADVKDRIEAGVAALAGRVEEAAELAELIRRQALPNRSPAAFVLPVGFDGGAGDAVTGLYRQPKTEVVGVVLIVEALGDPKAKRAIPKIDELVLAVLEAVAGWGPADAIGVFEARRGRLLAVNAGSVIYQIDFALSDQLRIAS